MVNIDRSDNGHVITVEFMGKTDLDHGSQNKEQVQSTRPKYMRDDARSMQNPTSTEMNTVYR